MDFRVRHLSCNSEPFAQQRPRTFSFVIQTSLLGGIGSCFGTGGYITPSDGKKQENGDEVHSRFGRLPNRHLKFSKIVAAPALPVHDEIIKCSNEPILLVEATLGDDSPPLLRRLQQCAHTSDESRRTLVESLRLGRDLRLRLGLPPDP